MAEKVQQRIEKRLPEFEDLLAKELFSQEELNHIIKKRRAFEFAVSRHAAKKTDYIRYIKYEISLEELRIKRKSRLSKKPKDSVSDYAGVKHIHNLFQRCLFKFKGDVLLWLQYIDFSQKHESNRILKQIFSDALRLHPTKEVLWVQAATWEFSTNYNTEAARNLFQKALRLNPKSQTLWLEYFRLELKFTEKIKLRRSLLLKRKVNDLDSMNFHELSSDSENVTPNFLSVGDNQVQSLNEDDPILSGALSQTVYQNAIEDIPHDIEFRVRFLDIYGQFSGNQVGNQLIYSTLLRDFPGDARALDLSIRKPLEKFSPGSKDYILSLESCVAKYDESLSSNFTSRLALFYAQFLRDALTKNDDEALKKYLKLKLKSVLSNSRKRTQEKPEILLSSELYIFYIEVLMNVFSKDSQAREVAEEASRIHPNEVTIWKLLINLVPEKDCFTRVSFLETALNYCCSSVDLWNLYLESHLMSASTQENSENSDVALKKHEELFLDSLRKLSTVQISCDEEKDQRDQAKDIILKHLLSWAFQAEGILYVRILAERASSITLLSADFYRKWIEIELSNYHENPHGDKAAPKNQEMLDSFRSLFDQRQAQIASETLKRIVSLYDSMVELQPSDISCWLEYLAFLFTAGSPHQGSIVLNRAKSLLDLQSYSQLEKDYIDFQERKALE